MNLTLAIVVAVVVTLAVWIGQVLFGEFSLFTVGATFLVVSAACSGIEFMRSTAKSQSQSRASNPQPSSQE